MSRIKGLYILGEGSFDLIYGPEERRDIAELADIYAPPQTRESILGDMGLLADAEVIFSGWGAPLMDESFLASAPKLKAVFYASGSVKYFLSKAFWERDILVTCSFAANAIPVAEFASSAILLGLKRFWGFAADLRRDRAYPKDRNVPGAYGSTVGLVSMGMVGRLVRERLCSSDLRVIAFDPYLSRDDAGKLRVESVSMEQLFREADVVSLHTPWLPETEGMIRGAHFDSMKRNSAFINTARGAIVMEAEMIEALRRRPDLTAVLDVAHPEPPASDSPLFTLPNVVLTPHIAGSLDGECRRMGRFMVEEFRRYASGRPMKWVVTREMLPRAA